MADDLTPDRYSSPLRPPQRGCRVGDPVAERLLRRATHPVGVVDVRGVQDHYERASSWPRQHVSLLDRWVSRYGAEAQQDQRADHVFAARLQNAVASAVDVPPPATIRSDAHRSATAQHPEIHTGPAMRAAPLARTRATQISRRAAPGPDIPVTLADPPSASPRRETVAASADRLMTTPSTPSPGDPTVLPLVSRATSSAAPDSIQRAGNAGVTVTQPIPSVASARDTALPNTTNRMATTHTAEAGRPPVSSSNVLVQRRVAAPGVTTGSADAPSSEITWRKPATAAGRVDAAASSAGLPSPAARSREETFHSTQASTIARARVPEWHRGSSTSTSLTAADAPIAVSQSSSLARSTATNASLAEERGQTVVNSPATEMSSRTEPVRVSASSRPLASAQPLTLPRSAASVVQRFRAADAPSSEIVWRKSSASSGGGAAAGVPAPISRSREETFLTAPPSTIARAHAPEGSSGSSTSTSLDAAAAMGADRRAPDTSQITEQVTRRLLRQIAVERERRGGSRWP
jgi:hypothetical protein